MLNDCLKLASKISKEFEKMMLVPSIIQIFKNVLTGRMKMFFELKTLFEECVRHHPNIENVSKREDGEVL